MNDLEQLKTRDAHIAEGKRILNFLHEQCRERINRNNLNKNEAQNAEKHKLVPTGFKCPECGGTLCLQRRFRVICLCTTYSYNKRSSSGLLR